MRATSQASLDAASQRWEPVLAEAGERAVELGRELYSVSDLLDGDVSLSRALTDPARSAEDKGALAQRLLAGKADDRVVDLVAGLARSRWSDAADLAEGVELLAVDAVLAAAQARGALETVEDELFRFGRLLTAQRELRMALRDEEVPAERRLAVVDSLLSGRVQPETKTFVDRTVGTLRERSIFRALARIGERAAERRSRIVATVISASPLTETQKGRLQAVLDRAYGRPVQVNVGVDERLVGGLRITVGSQVVDASVLARLDEARRRLAS